MLDYLRKERQAGRELVLATASHVQLARQVATHLGLFSGRVFGTDQVNLKGAAKRIHDSSGATVLAKGGVRLSGPDAVDVFYDGSELEVLSEPKVGEVPVSGAGCSLAAAVAAELAKGASEIDAARTAKAFVSAGIRHRLDSHLPFESLWQGGLAAES